MMAVAKSVLKPGSIQAMHLDVFNLVDFELINARAMPIITGAQAEQTYAKLKNNLPALAMAYFFTEVIDKFAFDYQKDKAMWGFLISVMQDLNKPEESRKISLFFRTRQKEFLDILGYTPNFRECAYCSGVTGGEYKAYSPEVRGIICQDCFLAGRKGIVLKNDEFFSESLFNSIFESLVEKKLHSLDFLNSVIQ